VRAELTKKAKQALDKIDTFKLKTISSPYTLELQLMCPNLADSYEKIGAERVDYQTVILRSDNLIDLYAQRVGWASGVYSKKFG
jgi:D-aminopeptidase